MSIPDSMMNDEIRNSAHYMTYLALSTHTEVPKVTKGKGRGLMGIKKPDADVPKGKKKEAVKKKDLAKSISLTKAEHQAKECRLHETHASLVIGKESNQEAVTSDSDETKDEEVQPLIRRSTGVVIGKEVPKKSAEEALYHFKKLKGIETLSAATQIMLDIKTATKASKLDYRIQQQSKGVSKGSGIILEVSDEPKDITSSSSRSHSISDDEVEYISSNEENKAEDGNDVEKQAGEEEPVDAQAGTEQAGGEQTKTTSTPIPPTTQAEVTNVSESDSSLKLEQRHSELEKKVEKLSKIDHTNVIKESVQANVFNEVKNQFPKLLPKVVSDYVQPRMKSTVRDVLQNNPINLFQSSSTSTDSFNEYELKNMLYDKMQKSGSFQEHEKCIDLYNALIVSIDQHPTLDSTKEKKRRRRKDSEPSKDKDTAGSSKKGKAQSQLSKTDKLVNADETIQEAAIETEESVQDDVVNSKEQAQDDAAPKQDNSTWFTQDLVVKPETPDPDWHKEPNVDDTPEHTWFNELINAEKDPLSFDDLMGSTVDFTKFAKNHLKKDKITKADLQGQTFKLLKGTCRNSIELEYNMEQCYLALLDQLDWANPEGGKCPYDMSKPLPLQGSPGHLTIPVDFFFNNDLEYLKTENTERKYDVSLTKTKAARYELKGIKEMIPRLWSSTKEAYDKNTALVYCDTSNQGLSCVPMQRGKVENATAERLCGLDQLMERKESGGMYLLWVSLIGDVRTLMMDEAHASSYACSDSLLLTSLCCDDIHDITPRVSALAGCDSFVGGRAVETDYRLLMRTV
ncbi:hypothetical protein Tco_0562680 [Tanacetum coccineum]